MSRFFKSAAFPILIVVVLAFFAQKLIGNSHSGHGGRPRDKLAAEVAQLGYHDRVLGVLRRNGD